MKQPSTRICDIPGRLLALACIAFLPLSAAVGKTDLHKDAATCIVHSPSDNAREETDRHGTDANLFGHVLNKRTGEHLSHVSVSILGTMIRTSTDATGHYMIKDLPSGKHTVEVRITGYRTVRKTITAVENKTEELNFEITQDEIALDEVVVSANRNLALRRNAPTLVNVLDTKTFDRTHSMCLAQGLNFQPGVRTEDNCQNCGFSQVRINGLDGHYSQILIDSRPVFSALQGVYGLEQIPANMIDRVEIVRGGGSALFGSSAIGGTINIITKEPTVNFAELAHTLMSIGGKGAFENNTTMNGSVITDNNKAGFYVYGQSRQRNGYDRDGDGYTELPKLINRTVGFSSFIRLTDYSKFTLQYHGLNEFRRGGNHLDIPAHEANIAEQLDHHINGGGLTYDAFTPDEHNHFTSYVSFQTVSRKSYYGGTGDGSAESVADALKAYSITRDLNLVGGAQYVHTFDRLLFLPADFTAGAEFNYDGLKDKSLGYHTLLDQRVRIGSFFFQNEWKNDQWGILLGGRLDKHNLIHHLIFSPRINFRYNPAKDVNIRLTYAGGFRAPQAFDEDLHTTLAGGERIKTRLAKGLKEEKSNSISLSADLYHTFGSVQTNLLVEAFYTHLSDVFALRKLSDKDEHGNGILERYNANAANVFGFNIEGKAAFTSWFQLQAGVTLQKSRYRNAIEWDEEAPKEQRMMRTPNTYGYFTAHFTPVRGFSASLSGNYTGSMLVGHAKGSGVSAPVAVNTPAFFTLNAKLAYDFKLYNQIKLQVNCGIQNLTDAFQHDLDKGWNRDANYIYGPSMPRSWFIGAKISL